MVNWEDPRLARLERAGGAAWVWDSTGQRIVWATDAAAELWGVPDAFLLIDRPFGTTDPAAKDLSLAAHALEATESVETDIRLWKAGRRKDLPVMARLFARQPTGNLVLFTPGHRPNPKSAKQTAGPNPIAGLLDGFPLGMAIFSTRGLCLYANPAFNRIFNEKKRLSFIDLMGSPPGAERLIRALLASGSVRVTPTLFARGSEMTLQIDAALVQDHQTDTSAFLVQVQNASARRNREQHITQRFDTMKAMLESTISAWIVLNANLEVKDLGGDALEQFGDDLYALIGMQWPEARKVLSIKTNFAFERALTHQEPTSVQAATDVFSGTWRATPSWNAEDEFQGYHLLLSAPSAENASTRKPDEDALAPDKPTISPLAHVQDENVALIAHDNFQIVFADQRACELFGAKSPDELINRPFLDLFPADERRASRHFDPLWAGDTAAHETALQALSLDKTIHYLDAEFQLAGWHDEDVIVALLHDVTSDITAATTSPPSAHAGTHASLPFGLITTDSSGNIIEANTRACVQLGLKAEQAIGQAFQELLAQDDRAAFEIRRAAAHKTQSTEPLEVDVEFITSTDEIFLATLLICKSPNTESGLLIALSPQINKDARAFALEQSLQEARAHNNQKTAFLSAISHEMRTPLNAIIGFSDFMLAERIGPIGNVKYTGYVEDILLSGRHLLSLVNDLLDLTKIESGNYTPDITTVDVNRVIDQALRVIRPQADKKSISLSQRTSDNLPNIQADQRSLMQILLNLLSNAVKFTPLDGDVSVSASVNADTGLTIEVIDTGIGMSPKNILRALEPYGQVHSHAANDEPGTGLGLPLAKALAEANGARFEINSVPNQGTRALVIFPADKVVSDDL